MKKKFNYAPCGFILLTAEGNIIECNYTLQQLLKYSGEELNGQPIQQFLTNSSQLFYELYFISSIQFKMKIRELELSLLDKDGLEVPILVNADYNPNEQLINCVMFPIHNRQQYENELMHLKKQAEMEKDKYQLANQMYLQEKQQSTLQLQLAKKIQSSILMHDIDNEQLQIETYHQGMNELSGDVYGIYKINQHRYGVIIVDVMGHNISSALITMSLQSIFQRMILSGYTAVAIMKELDRHLHELFLHDEAVRHFATAIYIAIDFSKETLEWVNAGHPPAYLQSADGTITTLKSQNVPLGLFEDTQYVMNKQTFTSGDRVLLFTDGVDPLDSDHLQKVMRTSCSLSLPDIKEAILRSLKQEKEKAPKEDDECFILLELA